MRTDDSDSGWLRCFIGMPIRDETRDALAQAQAELRKVDVRASWVAPENMHLTAVFLGNIETPLVAELCDAVGRALTDCAAPACAIRGLGFFGGRTPRVLWAGVGDDPAPLEAVQARIASAVRSIGVAIEDRPYVPHVTLGRVRSSRGAAELLPVLNAHDATMFGEQAIDAVNLYQSHLQPGGVKYRVLHTWNLVGNSG